MRLRNVKDAAQKIASHPQYITRVDRLQKTDLSRSFNVEQPLHIEIGAGKGRFIYILAKHNPHINFIAIEKFDSVIVKLLDKMLEAPLDNLHLLRMDAEQIADCLPSSSVQKIYLNFSDPWPKARHEKRRLTHPRFLRIYQQLLVPSGCIEMKTDNRHLFEYSLLSMNQMNLTFEYVSLDLHAEEESINIMTEFEERYGQTGPIYKLTATYKEETNEKNLS